MNQLKSNIVYIEGHFQRREELKAQIEKMNINELAQEALEIALLRTSTEGIEAPNDILAVLKHCAGEVLEAINAYNTETDIELGAELADIIMCALIAGAARNIDMSSALENCLYKNRSRVEAKR